MNNITSLIQGMIREPIETKQPKHVVSHYIRSSITGALKVKGGDIVSK